MSDIKNQINSAKDEATVLREKLRVSEAALAQAKEALRLIYDLRGGMEKPIEHLPTRTALRAAEVVLWGRPLTAP